MFCEPPAGRWILRRPLVHGTHRLIHLGLESPRHCRLVAAHPLFFCLPLLCRFLSLSFGASEHCAGARSRRGSDDAFSGQFQVPCKTSSRAPRVCLRSFAVCLLAGRALDTCCVAEKRLGTCVGRFSSIEVRIGDARDRSQSEVGWKQSSIACVGGRAVGAFGRCSQTLLLASPQNKGRLIACVLLVLWQLPENNVRLSLSLSSLSLSLRPTMCAGPLRQGALFGSNEPRGKACVFYVS